MPLLFIIVFLAVMILGWMASKFLLSQRAHPHEITKEYAEILKQHPSYSQITVHNAPLDAPMWIEGTYKERPFLMTIFTLYKQANHGIPLHIHGYMSAIRISIPVRITGQEDVVVYRKVEQKIAYGDTLLDVAGGTNTEKLSQKATQGMVAFIQNFDALRYRSRKDISPLIVPTHLWKEEPMIISHERFYSSTDEHELSTILDGLHQIVETIEHP